MKTTTKPLNVGTEEEQEKFRLVADVYQMFRKLPKTAQLAVIEETYKYPGAEPLAKALTDIMKQKVRRKRT